MFALMYVCECAVRVPKDKVFNEGICFRQEKATYRTSEEKRNLSPSNVSEVSNFFSIHFSVCQSIYGGAYIYIYISIEHTHMLPQHVITLYYNHYYVSMLLTVKQQDYDGNIC